MNPLDGFGIAGWLIESLSHCIQVLGGEGLKTDIESDTAAFRKCFEKLLIKGNGNWGMAIPEEIESFKKGEKVKTKSLIPCDIGIDDVKKSPFEKVGEVVIQEGEDFF
jgi:hypothetical protein